MCLECFAAGQTGETCGACGAPRAKANQDVWGFDDPSPAGSPRAPPPVPAPEGDGAAARMERFLEANGEAPPAPPTPAWDWTQESHGDAPPVVAPPRPRGPPVPAGGAPPVVAPPPAPPQFRLPSGSDTLPSPPEEEGPPRPAWLAPCLATGCCLHISAYPDINISAARGRRRLITACEYILTSTVTVKNTKFKSIYFKLPVPARGGTLYPESTVVVAVVAHRRHDDFAGA